MNKIKFLITLGCLLSTVSATHLAEAKVGKEKVIELESSCLAKAVRQVNRKHTFADGGAYALKILYSGSFGSSLLVGHSDETDPTDYLVSVEHNGETKCKIHSIVYAEDGSRVYDYSTSDKKLFADLNNVYKIDLTEVALKLLDKIPESGYDNRVVCIVGKQVTGRLPMTHWLKNDRKVVTGSRSSFPALISETRPEIKLQDEVIDQVRGTDMSGIYLTNGTVDGKAADICLVENKPVLE